MPQLAKTNARCMSDVKRESTQHFVFILLFVKRFWLRVHGLNKVYELHRHRQHIEMILLSIQLPYDFNH